MQQDRESQVRQRAHAIWLEEGMPEGQSAHHWSRAESEFEADEAAATITPESAATQTASAPDAISTVEPESAATVAPAAVPDPAPPPEPVAPKKATRRKVKSVTPVR